jgi:dTMP kinase
MERKEAQEPTPGFIVLEGADYSGKTSVADRVTELLQDYCTGAKTHLASAYDPGCTKTANKIRTIVKDPDGNLPEKAHWLLFQAARIDLQEKVVRPATDKGGICIMQRWTDSTRVYQGAIQGIPSSDLDSLFKSTNTMVPQLIIHLRVSDKAAEKRYAEANRDEGDYFEKDEFRAKVRKAYTKIPTLTRKHDKLFRSVGDYTRADTENMYCKKALREVVDADQSLDCVVARCLHLICRELRRNDA